MYSQISTVEAKCVYIINIFIFFYIEKKNLEDEYDMFYSNDYMTNKSYVQDLMHKIKGHENC